MFMVIEVEINSNSDDELMRNIIKQKMVSYMG